MQAEVKAKIEEIRSKFNESVEIIAKEGYDPEKLNT